VIGGWLVKVLVAIAVIGFAVIELGSPLVARAQADDAAHEVANEAAFRLRDNYTQATLDDACKTEAAKQDVELVSCAVNEKREIVVKVTKHARSVLLDKFSATKDWYDVEASATAEPR
jgi:hypothetical protein